MRPIAHLNSPSDHGGSIVTASTKVFCEGKPVAPAERPETAKMQASPGLKRLCDPGREWVLAEEQVELTSQAKQEAERQLEGARADLAASLESARAGLCASAEDLARAAAEQVLGRALS